MIYFLELARCISDKYFLSISNQLANYGGILKVVHFYWDDLFFWRPCYVLMAFCAMYLMKINDLFSRISTISSYTFDFSFQFPTYWPIIAEF